MKRKSHASRRTLDVNLPQTLHDYVVDDVMSLTASPVASHLGPWSEVVRFKHTWLRENLLSKFTDVSTTLATVRRSAAISKWLTMEDRNARTNVRLFTDDTDFGWSTSGKIVHYARRLIRETIGEHPNMNILDGMFTNGASTRVNRSPVAIAQKFVGKANVTAEAWPLFKTYVLARAPQWAMNFVSGVCTPEFVRGSVLFTVPKNSDIDRVACKEPEINMYMQRGVGNYIREALRVKRGINLNDQTTNQRLAMLGSRDGSLATLDLSSASDLISEQLVFNLLPFDWFCLLNDIRVKRTIIDGVEHELNMFSSMGNGFTFELESLIFLALTAAVSRSLGVKGRISVYGDDIICPIETAKALSCVFSWFGFKVNAKKSFWEGSFRESCGGHYYYGCDVTPFFIRERIATLPVLIRFLNQLRKWACTDGTQYASDRYYTIWSKYARFVPAYLHCGKDIGDDNVLYTSGVPRRRLSRSTRLVRACEDGAYLHWLRGREEVESDFQTSTGSYMGDFFVARNRSWNSTIPLWLEWDKEVNPSVQLNSA